MRLKRKHLIKIIEAEIKLSDDEIDAGRRELKSQGGAAGNKEIASAIKGVSTDADKDKFSEDEYGDAYVNNDPEAERHADGDIVNASGLTNESFKFMLQKLIRESINEINYDGYEINPNEDGSLAIDGKNYILSHPIAGDVAVVDIRSEIDDGGQEMVFVKAKKPFTPDWTSVEKILKDEQIQTVKSAVLANKNEFEVSGEEGIFKFRRV